MEKDNKTNGMNGEAPVENMEDNTQETVQAEAVQAAMITKIIKRDGREAPFNIEKIAKAVFKAAEAAGGHRRAEPGCHHRDRRTPRRHH